MKGSWVLIGGMCVLPWSPPECGVFANLEKTVTNAPAAPGQSLHAPSSYPHSAHLRRTCPGRVQRKKKERVAGTRVVILQGPWRTLSQPGCQGERGYPEGTAESTELSSNLVSSQGACRVSLLCSPFLCPAVTSQGPEHFP